MLLPADRFSTAAMLSSHREELCSLPPENPPSRATSGSLRDILRSIFALCQGVLDTLVIDVCNRRTSDAPHVTLPQAFSRALPEIYSPTQAAASAAELFNYSRCVDVGSHRQWLAESARR
ncbi:hypothetical protein R1sor_009144 [Riccia sorocarpa]|uniref:Uncharacterized protein n=1 Tax=Riccia sorocarpa TaxID=122646 RepID=A0ABD3H8H6_9MARC